MYVLAILESVPKLFLGSAFPHLPWSQREKVPTNSLPDQVHIECYMWPQWPLVVKMGIAWICHMGGGETQPLGYFWSRFVFSEPHPAHTCAVHLRTCGAISLQRWTFRHWALDGAVVGGGAWEVYAPVFCTSLWKTPDLALSSFPLLVLQGRRTLGNYGLGSLSQPCSHSHSFHRHCAPGGERTSLFIHLTK